MLTREQPDDRDVSDLDERRAAIVRDLDELHDSVAAAADGRAPATARDRRDLDGAGDDDGARPRGTPCPREKFAGERPRSEHASPSWAHRPSA